MLSKILHHYYLLYEKIIHTIDVPHVIRKKELWAPNGVKIGTRTNTLSATK